jgi:hypothetical protein
LLGQVQTAEILRAADVMTVDGKLSFVEFTQKLQTQVRQL